MAAASTRASRLHLDPEELECTLYPNGFECSHENYCVSCNWEELWCQAADDWPG